MSHLPGPLMLDQSRETVRLPRSVSYGIFSRALFSRAVATEDAMMWAKPKIVEICIGMEINGYFAGKL